MKIINWNISWSNKTDKKVEYLRALVNETSFIIIHLISYIKLIIKKKKIKKKDYL